MKLLARFNLIFLVVFGLGLSVAVLLADVFLRNLHQRNPDYAYKEATLNPTNPRDRAADWEADVINTFRKTKIGKTSLANVTRPEAGRFITRARCELLMAHA